MINILNHFFTSHYRPWKPLLLAFSGGPDSLALLYLLLEYREKKPFELALAHVDHGWRIESSIEVKEITQLTDKLGLVLHQKKLDPKEIKGNLEAACREERYRFFASLCKDYSYQAVLLAHQADDLAETVLKRVFEGVTLPYLSSLSSVSELYGVKIWRPLLGVSKKTLLDYLEKKGLQGFDDKTNRDTKFLRAKMREQILPSLADSFGKEISSGLCQIGLEAGELREYLETRIQKYLDQIIDGPFGSFVDLTHESLDAFELKYFIRQFCKRQDLVLSREIIMKATEFIVGNAANKSFNVGSGKYFKTLHIDRRRLFIFSSLLPDLPLEAKVVEESSTVFGEWKIEITPFNKVDGNHTSDWKTIWIEGKGSIILPKKEYQVAAPINSSNLETTVQEDKVTQDFNLESFSISTTVSRLNKDWTNYKVPSLLRQKIPIILEKGIPVHEFLTGKVKEQNFPVDGQWIQVSLCREKS